MDKIKSILASASGKKAGPPVPPRPSPAAVQKALEKTRRESPNLQTSPPISPPVVRSRTVVFNSTSNINTRQADRQPSLDNASRENKCFDTKTDDSSTGLKKEVVRNGNSARLIENADVNKDKVTKVRVADSPSVYWHHKSPVPRPRSIDKKVSEPQVSTTQITLERPNFQQSSYSNLLRQNQNVDAMTKPKENHKTLDDELKEKLLNEMLSRSSQNESSSRLSKNFGSNLKRASSFDALNDSLGDKSLDRKIIFHEILISELSEKSRISNQRLSLAKSSPDISPNGNLNIFEINDRVEDRNSFGTLLNLEDSGVEDEGRLDDCSSSGVGDSWDSCKEIENR